MTRSRFSQTTNSANKRPSGAIAIVQLAIIGLVITLLAAIFIQNLQPTVQIFFLGQKTIAIPLSVTMMVAFVGGGILAFVINAIASWRQNLLIRRAIIASRSDNDMEEQVKPEKSQNKEEFIEEEEEEYEDDEWVDYEDNDPDTVPYGDRPNMKPQNTSQSKQYRPPIDAKFIK
ncbi:MAG: hypothetical protein DCF20_18325 [Pseudanabaena sp.]|nr:MAG: hypothetical protein DCF20_18325 [Pseudanabaena sp.]